MPRKKAKEVEASIEETQPIEEETPEVEETPKVPTEDAPVVEEVEEALKAEVEAPAAPSEVPVSSIPDGALFEHKGQLYSKRMMHRTGRVLADYMLKTRYPSVYHRTGKSAWLALDTLVKLK